jgi:hypothetical protein
MKLRVVSLFKMAHNLRLGALSLYFTMLTFKEYRLNLPFEIINQKTGRRLKSVMVGGSVGYVLGGKFYPAKKALSLFKAEEKTKYPF